MPLPLFIIIALLGTGTAVGTKGMFDFIDANERQKKARTRFDKAKLSVEIATKATVPLTDAFGKQALQIAESFKEFADLIERIHNRPHFEESRPSDISLPTIDLTKLREISMGATVLLNATAGATAGTLGGLAASGITAATIVALGTASTGVPIASLSGAAATNATLAVLGGGTLAAGGGGVALGSLVLGTATVGVAFLVGGFLFAYQGHRTKKQVEEIEKQVDQAEQTSQEICAFLETLRKEVMSYLDVMRTLAMIYQIHLAFLRNLVNKQTDWNTYNHIQKNATHSTVLLVNLLYQMIHTPLVIKQDNAINKVNMEGLQKASADAQSGLRILLDLK